LSLARIEARGAEAFEPIDLRALVERTVEAFGEEAARLEFTSHGEVRVRGDSVWLSRAISNLVDNALAHSPASSSVRLRLERGEHVELSVENQGQIPKYVRERVFRRFVTTRGDKGGSGLGLAIVRAVAEAHGGQAELSEIGPDVVRFSLKLPAA